jgi:hypothetical protein
MDEELEDAKSASQCDKIGKRINDNTMSLGLVKKHTQKTKSTPPHTYHTTAQPVVTSRSATRAQGAGPDG